MDFAVVKGQVESGWSDHVEQGIGNVMLAHGHRLVEDPQESGLVFHRVDRSVPRPFRRRSRATFVVGVTEMDDIGGPASTILAKAYPVLIRSMSNLLLLGHLTDDVDAPMVYMVTPELGCYPARVSTVRDLYEDVYERVRPLATSRLVIDNRFDEDLPNELWEGTRVTRELAEAARTLDRWELFPTPYPVEQILPPEDYRHLRHVFGIGGLSYGNLSARHDNCRFWMSASGVDKGKVSTVGRDILLVKGYDAKTNAMRISVPPGSQPLRVSVDAVEHARVYERHPEIGAMVHVHAWVDEVPTTEVNYPCGTVEMGDAMADLFDRVEHPERTVIGLKNHGITATGPSFPDILARLEGRVVRSVPMR